jgi:signal transduction histidine kinase
MADAGRLWRSVRVRIAVAAAVVSAVALAGAGWLLIRSVEDTQLGRLRDVAEDSLDAVAARLGAGADPQLAAEAADPTAAVVIVDEDGRVVGAGPVTLTGGLGTVESPLGQAGGTLVVRGEGAPGTPPIPPGEGAGPGMQVRVLGSDAPFEQVTRQVSTPGGELTVVAGAPIDEVGRSVDAVRRALWAGVPLVALLVGALSWALVGRALRPVEAIRTEVEAISGSSMHRRVPEPPTDDEIGRLARTMNAMLGRLQGAAARQRQFVSDASHELRSPVAAIRTDVEVALREGPSADWPAVGSAVLVEEDRLERLLADLLVLAAGDEGGPVEPSTVDLAALAAGESERARRVPVEVSVPATPARAAGSPDALRRALSHLVDNAARHARTRVAVTVGPGRLVVDDDGPGIPEPDRERVFERFTRLDDARARDQGGAGLGLAVVRSIATRHGGTVQVEASPLGGARVVVALPPAG